MGLEKSGSIVTRVRVCAAPDPLGLLPYGKSPRWAEDRCRGMGKGQWLCHSQALVQMEAPELTVWTGVPVHLFLHGLSQMT